jgi:RND family efflux transporter MFP subunit
MKPHLLLTALMATLTVSVPFLSGCESKAASAAAKPPPPKVSVGVVTVTHQDLPLSIEAVATLDGYVNAEIRARVRGFLRSQDYKDGATVKQGQTLFTIDASEYVATLEAAKANLARATTAQWRTKIELDRDLALFQSGNVSQQDVDNARASVADAEGQVHGARAALEQAQLNLSYTTVQAPITGVAGVALVRVGNLVGQAEPTLLTTVSQTDPMRVTFSLSEVDYVRYPERFQHLEKRDLTWARAEMAKLDSATGGGSDAAVDVVLAEGAAYPHRGVIVSINRNIDSSTGTVQMQALVRNPDGLLRPGQYARVRMPRGDEGKDVLAVPERALVSVQGQYSLAVVGANEKVSLKRVALGASAGGMRVVTTGLAEGDRIVVDGTQRVADGATVDAHDTTTVAAQH